MNDDVEMNDDDKHYYFQPRLDGIDKPLERIDERLEYIMDAVDDRFAHTSGWLRGIDQRLGRLETAVENIDARLDGYGRAMEGLITAIQKMLSEMALRQPTAPVFPFSHPMKPCKSKRAKRRSAPKRTR
jgi:hypothetical protein